MLTISTQSELQKKAKEYLEAKSGEEEKEKEKEKKEKGKKRKRRGSDSEEEEGSDISSGTNCIKIGLPGKRFSVREKVFGKTYSLESTI